MAALGRKQLTGQLCTGAVEWVCPGPPGSGMGPEQRAGLQWSQEPVRARDSRELQGGGDMLGTATGNSGEDGRAPRVLP